MIAVGIPSYNEADNIASLVKSIDAASISLKVPIVIINADNNSPDNTATVFKQTVTSSKKISLITNRIGKGSNVFAIFHEVVNHPEIDYLFLVDADIQSFDKEWLQKHYQNCIQGADYVLPSYKRKYIEGNGTNHFAYPMMRVLLNGDAPKQPIAGDIGLSRDFILYLIDKDKPASSYGYGVDMFISAYAVSFKGLIVEIDLDKKIHKPSFPKMITIFRDEASSYYYVRSLGLPKKAHFSSSGHDVEFLDSEPIPESDVANRLEEAQRLFSEYSLLKNMDKQFSEVGKLSLEEWIEVLKFHESLLGSENHDNLAKSLLPFYLLRVITYLKECSTPLAAKEFITYQAQQIQKCIK